MGCVAKRSSVIKHEKKSFLFCVNFFFVCFVFFANAEQTWLSCSAGCSS